MSNFLDPPRLDQGPLGLLSDALEAATDEYGTACDDNAESENEYLYRFSLAWEQASTVAATVRREHCNNRPDVVVARQAWNTAQARERRCRAKCQELQNRLMATMSWQRTVGAQV